MATEYTTHDGRKGNPHYCKASVYSGSYYWPTQCSRKAKKDGWCHQHHPDTEAERKAKSVAKWKAEYNARAAQSRHQQKAAESLALLKQIARGHNDPIALARGFFADRGEHWENQDERSES